jgi:hypothetical protein
MASLLRRQLVRLRKKLEAMEEELKKAKEHTSTNLEYTDWSSYSSNIIPFLAKKKITDN